MQNAQKLVRLVGRLFDEDGKDPEVMVSDDYFAKIKKSKKNIASFGYRAAALSAFM